MYPNARAELSGAALTQFLAKVNALKYIDDLRKSEFTIKWDADAACLSYKVLAVYGAGCQRIEMQDTSLNNLYITLIDHIRMVRPKFDDCTSVQQMKLYGDIPDGEVPDGN